MRNERPTRPLRPRTRSPGPPRPRATGSVLIAVLTVLLMLVLAAGMSPRVARLLSAPPAPGLVPTAGGGIGEFDAPGPAAVAGALDEPAIARASEAMLRRMRVQFAQTLQPSLPSVDGLGALADAVASLGPRGQAPAAAPSAEPSRDARDPRSSRDAPAARAEESPRRIDLPARGAGDAPAGSGSVTLVGQATVLIRSHGFTVLADPNFLRRGEPARVAPGLSVTRRADPAMELDELPPVDLVVLTRLRDDHFDRLVRRRLPRDVPIVAPASARGELVAMGFSSVHGLADWAGLRLVRGDAWLQLTSTPTRSDAGLLSVLSPASMGALIELGRGEAPPARRIWLSGGATDDAALLAQLRSRLGDLDLALPHVGAARWSALLGGAPHDAGALALVAALAPRTVIPLRLDDFASPATTGRAFADAARSGVAAPHSRIRLLSRGDTLRLGPPEHWALARDALDAPR